MKLESFALLCFKSKRCVYEQRNIRRSSNEWKEIKKWQEEIWFAFSSLMQTRWKKHLLSLYILIFFAFHTVLVYQTVVYPSSSSRCWIESIWFRRYLVFTVEQRNVPWWMFYRSTPDNFLTFLLLLVLHLAVSSCLFLFVQHGLSLGRNIISFHLLNKRGQVRRKLNPWEVILDREELAVIHTVEHPLGLDVIPEGYQNLRESLNTDVHLIFTST